MAKIYVASNEVDRTKKVITDLIKSGHTIIFDWTTDIEKEDEQDKIGKILSIWYNFDHEKITKWFDNFNNYACCPGSRNCGLLCF